MKKGIAILIMGLVAAVIPSDLSAYSRGICSGYGGGPRVHVHVHGGSRYNQRGNDLVLLLMLSSTSTSIYCISIADEEEEWRGSRRRRYSLINYDRLKEEGARGRGEYLTALSFHMGCPSTVTDDFAAAVQQQYRTVFKASSDFQIDHFMNQLEGIISDNPKLRAACGSGSSDPKQL